MSKKTTDVEKMIAVLNLLGAPDDLDIDEIPEFFEKNKDRLRFEHRYVLEINLTADPVGDSNDA
jgi:hypothetical protein